MTIILGSKNTIFDLNYNSIHDKKEFWRMVMEKKFNVKYKSNDNAFESLKKEVTTVYEKYNK